MPRYRVRTEELRRIYDPLDGVRWGSGAIILEDVYESVQDGVLELRSWQEVNNHELTPEQLRTYHLKRLATLIGLAANNVPPGLEPPDRRIRLVMVLPEAEVVQKVWLYDGNHRVAVAYLMGDEHIELEITADEALLPTVLPGAVLLPDDPAAAEGCTP